LHKGQKRNFYHQKTFYKVCIDRSIQHLVAFGTQCTCFISSERREERKGPGQKKAFTGVIVGYAEGMQAYRVWDLEKKKKVSFYFCIISEGYFPFKDRRNWPSQAEPLS